MYTQSPLDPFAAPTLPRFTDYDMGLRMRLSKVMPAQDNLDMTSLRLFGSKLEWKDHVRLDHLKILLL